MQIWRDGFRRSLTGCVVIAIHSSVLRSETTGEAYLRLSEGISSLEYSDFLHQRPTSPHTCDTNPDLKKSIEYLDRAMALKTNLEELSELAGHAEPKVRTLAMMRLYNMEEPAAFKVIFSMANDESATFPGRDFLTEDPQNRRTLLSTTPMKISELSKKMLKQAGFPPLGTSDADIEPMLAGWVGWYQHLYLRATGNTSPIRAERTPRIVAVREKIDALPDRTRAWMLLAIGAIDLHTNEHRDPREDLAPLFATEAELIAAAKQLGPDVLITFLRDGSRAGLRDPKCTAPDNYLGYRNDRKFILEHAAELFRKSDAEALKSMGESIAAADADPEQASTLIREMLESSANRSDRGKALAALLDHCGDRESEYIVSNFYDVIHTDHDQNEFIHEVERRNPKEWKNTFRKIVGHPSFDDLKDLTVIYFANLTSQLGKAGIPTGNRNGNLPLPEIHKSLRAYFGLP